LFVCFFFFCNSPSCIHLLPASSFGTIRALMTSPRRTIS
jgi:hypothetical protein